ncbi:hypothetical protein IDG88_01730 [Pelagibacterales bacterium SAG-MED03]|nr:hypothetical protein [Pelagibacterales bacterium SAG-MED03]
MNIKNTFKKLILLNIGLFFLTFISVFFESDEVIRFNEALDAIPTSLLIIGLIWMILYFVSLYFLYTFKKNGKKLFSILFVLGIVLNLPLGPSAVDSLTYTLDALSWCSQSAILVFLYFTKIEKHFN